MSYNIIGTGKWYTFIGDNNYPELQNFVKGNEYYSPEDGKISVGTDIIEIDCKGGTIVFEDIRHKLPKTLEEFCEQNKVKIQVPEQHLSLMQLHQFISNLNVFNIRFL